MNEGRMTDPGHIVPGYSWLWPILFILVLAFSVHLWPLAISEYPLNNDSLVEGFVARDIVETGTIRLPGSDDVTTTHSESTPAWNVLLAFTGALVGEDPMFACQSVVATISVLTPLLIYMMLVLLGANRSSALAGAFFISLFGTFLYLSASGWKLALGVQLYVLLVYCYSQRSKTNMRLLMLVLLLLLPVVHHLAALIGYMTFAFLTGWSWFFVLARGRPTRTHYYDLVTIAFFAALAFGYYYVVSLDRLSYIGSSRAFVLLLTIMVLLLLVAVFQLLRQSHSKWTFAPLPAAIVLVIGILDYNGYLFDYEPSQTFGMFLLLAVATSFMVFLAWFGFEVALESRSRYRAIPVGMLLPAASVILFALVSPTVESKHQLIYRTFDFADPALALGIGMALWGIYRTRNMRRVFPVAMAAFVALLLSTVPYGIYTETFTGVRHDTQAYEIDAFDWVIDAHYNETPLVNGDERISYIAWTLYGLGKDNTLPRVLSKNESLVPGVFNLYEESWSAAGVNDFPAGLRVIDPEFMSRLLEVTNVFYVGGPVDDRLYVIQHTWIGQISHNWYYEQ